jgi:hypothetical protein
MLRTCTSISHFAIHFLLMILQWRIGLWSNLFYDSFSIIDIFFQMINFWIVLKGDKGSPIIQRIGKQALIIGVLIAYVYETDNCERDKLSNFYFHRISKYFIFLGFCQSSRITQNLLTTTIKIKLRNGLFSVYKDSI